MLQPNGGGGGGGGSFGSIDTSNFVKYTDPAISIANWVIDEDTFITNSDILVPTQQSVKSYVDSQISLSTSWFYQRVSNADSPIIATTKTFYLIDTTTGPVEIYLPSGTNFDYYGFADVANNFDITPATIYPSNPDTIAGYPQIVLNTKYACFTTVYDEVLNQHVFTSAEDFVDDIGVGVVSSGLNNLINNLGTQVAADFLNIDWSLDSTQTVIIDSSPGVVTIDFINLPVDRHKQLFLFLRYVSGGFSFPSNVAWSGMTTIGSQYVFDVGYDYLIIFDALGGPNIGAGVSIKSVGALF